MSYKQLLIAALTAPERQIAATQDDCAYADVYDQGGSVLKVMDTPYVLPEESEENVETLQERDVPYAETVVFPMDLRDIGYRRYACVALQEKAAVSTADAVADDGEQYLADVVDVLDTGVENGVVIRDAKLDNFARFPDGVKLIDVTDDESFNAYYADLGNDHRHRFMDDCSAMYRNLVRSAADHLEQSPEEIVDRVASASRYLDADQLTAEPSSETGLEQGLTLDYDEITAALPPEPDDPHPFEEAAELGVL